MARFDVHASRSGALLLLDCQANVLGGLNTRFVVPLQPEATAPKAARRLNPVFEIEGVRYVMMTQFASAVPLRDLGRFMLSLAAQGQAITDALDMLTCGF